LVEGRGGVFDIDVDGARKFSKHETGRFPTEADLDTIR
jgi:predicted Rdx family selenoprotein